MKILLLGANGQLGQTLSRTLPAVGEVKSCGRNELDLSDLHSIRAVIEQFQPDIIVNAAAYTAVDKAESEPELAFKVNAEALATLAEQAVRHDILLVHYSSDYVFDGSKKDRYNETDTPNPINLYGESKLAGEKAITASGCKHLIFRTTWVMGQNGQNFTKTILRLAAERPSLNIINDQFGVPTTTALISRVTIAAIEASTAATPWPSGIYHLAPHGETSWYGIAQELLQLAQEQQLTLATSESSLHPIKTIDYPTAAKRPVNSLLNTDKLEKQLSFSLSDWKNDFRKVANEIIKEFKSK